MKKNLILLSAFVLGLMLVSCQSQPELTPEDAREIAREAYIYGYPIVDNYRIIHTYFVNSENPEFKAPWNLIKNIPRVYTPADRAVQTPNSDTPYSWVGLDLRAEPIIITVPPIEKSRYYSVQLFDLYTYIFDYIGSRTTGNNGGKYLVAGPGWKGSVPEGVSRAYYCETEIGMIIFRTQLNNPEDIENVIAIQKKYKVETLSSFLGEPAPPAESDEFTDPLSPEEIQKSIKFFGQLNTALEYCPTHSSEKEMMARFAKLDIAAGLTFDFAKFSPVVQEAIGQGIADAWAEFGVIIGKVKKFEITSDEIFGSRDFLQDNYMYRMVACVLGIGGNAGEEAIYPGFYVDDQGKPLVGANNYSMYFAPDQLPPVNAFWSMTMYEEPSKLLSENVLDRYLLNSSTMDDYVRDEDGGITMYLQHSSPGKALEANWLPAPEGPFSVILRLYWPKEEALAGTWIIPEIMVLK